MSLPLIQRPRGKRSVSHGSDSKSPSGVASLLSWGPCSALGPWESLHIVCPHVLPTQSHAAGALLGRRQTPGLREAAPERNRERGFLPKLLESLQT